MNTSDNQFPIQSGKTMLDVVEVLRRRDNATVTEIAAALDISKSTAYNHVTTLRSGGYLRKDGSRYKLSFKFLEIGDDCRRRNGVYEIARPEIEKLAAETNEVANLMFEEGGRGVHVYRSRNEVDIQLPNKPGMRVPLHCTSLGKAILAHRPDEWVRDVVAEHGLSARTEHTITDEDALFEELEDVRTRGYALDREENILGLRCVAVPIHHDERVVASISVSGPKRRMKAERFREEVPELLLSKANVIELNIRNMTNS
jgi:DNA-binding IclR family transcriptional regulator